MAEILKYTVTHSTTPPDHFLRDEVLDADFYLAANAAAIPDFEISYLLVHHRNQHIVTAPYFVTHFRLGTMLASGWIKEVLANVGFKIACVGHPCTPFGRIDSDTAITPELIGVIALELQKYAATVVFKGFGDNLPAPGFVRVAGLPVAKLALRERFWDTMPRFKRNIQRKRKVAAALRFEVVPSLPSVYAQRIYELYLETQDKAEIQFGKLSLDYFLNTAHMSHYVLAFLGDRLVGFVQLIQKGARACALYIGMDNSCAREHGTYFALVIESVEASIQLGCREIELGETHYEFKENLGSALTPTWVYYKHKNPVAHFILKLCAPLLEA